MNKPKLTFQDLMSNMTPQFDQVYPMDEFRHTIHKDNRELAIEPFRTTLIILTIVLSIVGLVGAVGNALVIYAFRRNYSSSSSNSGRCVGGGSASNLFIIILAAIDLTICLFDIPMTLYWTVWQMSTFDFVCKLHVSLKAFFIPTSSLVLVLIAVDRFLIICFVPGIQMRPRTTLVALMVAFLLGLAMAIPMGLHIGVENEISVGNDQDDLMGGLKPLIPKFHNISIPNSQMMYGRCIVNEYYIKNIQYKHYLHTLFGIFILMFIAITFLYAIIFIFVWWRQRRWFRRYSSDGLGNSAARNTPSIKVDDISQTTTSELGPDVKNRINISRQRKSLCISIQMPLKILKKQQQKPPPEVILPLTTLPEGDPQNLGYDSDQVDIELCPQSPATEKRITGISTAQRKKHHDRCVQSSIRRRRSGSESGHMKRRKPHIRTAQTLAIITITFIVSYLPYLIIINVIVAPSRNYDSTKATSLREHFQRFFFYLYFFNSAANPIIYSCMNVTFREEVIRILQRIKRTFCASV